ncbi:MAG: lysophospholipid acyltransferase family protein [Bacteroidota bacterium]
MRQLGAHFWYAWTMFVYLVMSILMWTPFRIALWLKPTARTFWLWLRAWSRAIFAAVGFRVAARHEAEVGEAVVYVSNHQAAMDIPVLTIGLQQPFVFLARSELRRVPFVGGILHGSRCVLMDRSSGEGVARAMEESKERLQSGESVLFFPEGTRGYEQMKPFRRGAFRLAMDAGVPVVPVAIDGSHRILNERQKVAAPGRVHVRVGAPMPALPGEDERQYADRAQAEVERLLAA